MKYTTVKPVLTDHHHERPPVLTDHTFVTERKTYRYISIQLNLPQETTCLDRPHFCAQWGGLSRQVLLQYKGWNIVIIITAIQRSMVSQIHAEDVKHGHKLGKGCLFIHVATCMLGSNDLPLYHLTIICIQVGSIHHKQLSWDQPDLYHS